MDIHRATDRYEAWLARHLTFVAPDLDSKHTQMAKAPFPFLRATFYRWAQQWALVPARLAKAPVVLSVGDLHIENFGTWRDSEGRLIWGINDFDEAYPLPYTNDLVRLATSVHLTIAADRLSVKSQDACNAILAGYAEGLRAGGRPFVLAEEHPRLRAEATSSLRDPAAFWAKLAKLPTVHEVLPQSAIKAIERLLPEAGLHYRVAHRIAGLGSLGRQRWVAIAEWHGGYLAREAKALAPSAWIWANGGKEAPESFYPAIVARAVRAPDPYVQLTKRWVTRRLAPDCSRIELEELPHQRDESWLLHAMGWETANVHLGSRNAITAVAHDLLQRPQGWLHRAAEEMAHLVNEDWTAWKEQAEPPQRNT